MHELGHVLGNDDLPVADHPHDLMAENILPGMRRDPGRGSRALPQTGATSPAPSPGSPPGSEETPADIESYIAAQNPGGGGPLAISGDTFVSCTAFTVESVSCRASTGDAPPRSTGDPAAIDR